MVFGFPLYIEVLMISIAMSLISVMITKFFGDQNAVKALKADMKALNARVKKAQKAGDTAEMNKRSGELMKLSGKQFQLNMRPMFISMGFFIGVLWLFGNYYTEMVVASPIDIPFVGSSLGWFHWYFLIVISTSFMFRKLLSVE